MVFNSYVYITAILTLYSFNSIAQNLVVDPSFENKIKCPKGIVLSKKKFVLIDWKIPTGGTTDYMNKCNKYGVSVPKNIAGEQKAKDGNGYIRILAGKTYGTNYVEYIQGKLASPLIEGKEYEVEFWVSLGEYSPLSASCLGAFLSADEIERKGGRPLKVQPQIRSTNFITDTNNWVKISGTYIAQGEEKFITIGAFPRKGVKDYKLRMSREIWFLLLGSPNASYYIDDVKVELKRVDKGSQQKELDTLTRDLDRIDTLALNPVILENVFFDVGSSRLGKESNVELDSLISFLNSNEHIHIQLNGHTDNSGIEKENLKLSAGRVKAVRDYLVSGGINSSRIKFIGFGSLHPIRSNNTEQGKQANRRVEFVIVKY